MLVSEEIIKVSSILYGWTKIRIQISEIGPLSCSIAKITSKDKNRKSFFFQKKNIATYITFLVGDEKCYILPFLALNFKYILLALGVDEIYEVETGVKISCTPLSVSVWINY